MTHKISLLAYCSEDIPLLAELWLNEIGKPWIPNATLNRAIQTYHTHLNEKNLPLTFVAHENNLPIAMVSLRQNDGIRDDLQPWLGSLIVSPSHRRRGIGQELISTTKNYAQQLGFEKLYLFTLDPTIHRWYESLGWIKIAEDQLYNHPVNVMEINL